jgi:hypothetical protein
VAWPILATSSLAIGTVSRKGWLRASAFTWTWSGWKWRTSTNTRDYDITKYVSLVLLNPLALIALKETGHCIVELPESSLIWITVSVWASRLSKKPHLCWTGGMHPEQQIEVQKRRPHSEVSRCLSRSTTASAHATASIDKARRTEIDTRNFNGAPYGSLASPLNLVSCWLQVFSTASYIGTIAPTRRNNHLIPGIIEDVFLVCHYSVS